MKTIYPILKAISLMPNMKLWLSVDSETGMPPELPDHAQAGRPRKAPISNVRAGHTGMRRLSGGRGARAATGSVSVPLAPEKRIQRVLAEAFYGRGHLALKGLPPHLAVGHNLETGLFLERHRIVHGAVLDPFEFSGSQRARRKLFLGREQFRRAEQTADDVRFGVDHNLVERDSSIVSRSAPRIGFPVEPYRA